MFPIKVQRQVCYCFVITIIVPNPIDITIIKTSKLAISKEATLLANSSFSSLCSRSFCKIR